MPSTAVTFGIVLALASLGMLIYFIDHIFHGVQVSSIIASISKETRDQIDLLYPKRLQPGDPTPQHPATRALPLSDHEWAPVPATDSGYLQYIDYEALLQIALASDIVVREERAVGAFIIAGAPVAHVHPGSRLSPQAHEQLNQAFVLGSHATLQQDVAYGLRQIVDIALKAISPAINDPTTAVNCIDHLGVILATLAARQMGDQDRADASGKLRVIVHERTFRDYARLAFDQIRHYGAKDHVIVLRMLDTIAQVAAVTSNPDYLDALDQQVQKIITTAERDLVDEQELQVVRAHMKAARLAVHQLVPGAQDAKVK